MGLREQQRQLTAHSDRVLRESEERWATERRDMLGNFARLASEFEAAIRAYQTAQAALTAANRGLSTELERRQSRIDALDRLNNNHAGDIQTLRNSLTSCLTAVQRQAARIAARKRR